LIEPWGLSFRQLRTHQRWLCGSIISLRDGLGSAAEGQCSRTICSPWQTDSGWIYFPGLGGKQAVGCAWRQGMALRARSGL